MQRFWDKVDMSGDCWLWTGAKSSSGYGHLTINKKTIKAHRFSYETSFGLIKPNEIVMHSCDTPLCVNPKHLSVGTKKDNARDMLKKHRQNQQSKTHCPKGHEYNEENTYVFVSPSTGASRRQCKECMRSWSSYNRWNKESRFARGGVI